MKGEGGGSKVIWYGKEEGRRSKWKCRSRDGGKRKGKVGRGRSKGQKEKGLGIASNSM